MAEKEFPRSQIKIFDKKSKNNGLTYIPVARAGKRTIKTDRITRMILSNCILVKPNVCMFFDWLVNTSKAPYFSWSLKMNCSYNGPWYLRPGFLSGSWSWGQGAQNNMEL